MTRRKRRKSTYRVLRGIANAATGESYEVGEVVALGEKWNVAWLLEVGAIEPVMLSLDKEPEVTDGDRQDA